jgi:Bacterial PH domain
VPIRPGAPGGDEPSGPEDPLEHDESVPAPPLTSVTWRVDRSMMAAKVVGIVAFAAIPQVFQTNNVSRWFGIIVAVALAIYLLRDLLAPVRLAADQDGVTVIAGFAGHRTLPWADVDRVRVDKRRRSGFLEVETTDTLHLFSRYDLSMTPVEAAEMLERVRPAA